MNVISLLPGFLSVRGTNDEKGKGNIRGGMGNLLELRLLLELKIGEL